MDCKESERYWLSLIDDSEQSVPPAARRHIDSCARCRARYDALRGADGALRRAIPILAPERTYLNKRRLNALLGAAEETYTAPAAIRSFDMRYAAMAAALLVVIGGGLLLFAWPGARNGNRPVDGEDRAEAVYAVVNDFDRVVETTAKAPAAAEWTRSAPADVSEMLIRVGGEGISVPVRETTSRPRQDDLWW